MQNFSPIHQTVTVPFRYSVEFTTGLFSADNPLLARVVSAGRDNAPAKILVVVDSEVARSHPDLLANIAGYCQRHAHVFTLIRAPLLVPGGEACKNSDASVQAIHHAIHEAGICRHSYVIAIGGGAVLDMAGYAAATAHRGVRLIRVPTTTLSQNDSAVGVKNSVNAFDKKNFLGTFAPPYAVLNDFDFLTTLHDRDWRGGIAEAVKVALIRDAGFFHDLEASAPALAARHLDAMQRLIYRCAELHLQHIAQGGDPFEFGSSRPLDFGHWAAHKLEQLTAYRLRHGEAVAIGIALDATYSLGAGLLSQADWRRILELLEAVGFALYAPELDSRLDTPDHPQSLLHGLAEFREHLGGQLTIMLLTGVGQSIEIHDMDADLLRESIARLRQRHQARSSRPPSASPLKATLATARIETPLASGENAWTPLPAAVR